MAKRRPNRPALRWMAVTLRRAEGEEVEKRVPVLLKAPCPQGVSIARQAGWQRFFRIRRRIDSCRLARHICRLATRPISEAK
jgi:hypothetical protein